MVMFNYCMDLWYDVDPSVPSCRISGTVLAVCYNCGGECIYL